MTADEKFMKAAITQARKAYAIDEVPIGCVIVQNDKIIARGYARTRQISVLTRESSSASPSAFRFSGEAIIAMLDQVKVPSLSVRP